METPGGFRVHRYRPEKKQQGPKALQRREAEKATPCYCRTLYAGGGATRKNSTGQRVASEIHIGKLKKKKMLH